MVNLLFSTARRVAVQLSSLASFQMKHLNLFFAQVDRSATISLLANMNTKIIAVDDLNNRRSTRCCSICSVDEIFNVHLSSEPNVRVSQISNLILSTEHFQWRSANLSSTDTLHSKAFPTVIASLQECEQCIPTEAGGVDHTTRVQYPAAVADGLVRTFGKLLQLALSNMQSFTGQLADVKHILRFEVFESRCNDVTNKAISV